MSGKVIERESLETISAIQLSDRVTSLYDVNCRDCDEILWPPIMLGKKGNICGNCYHANQISKSDEFVPNIAVEKILEELSIKCCNSYKGCKVRDDYRKMAVHNKLCTYRSFFCPLDVIYACMWMGCSYELVDHIIQEHPKEIIKTETDCVLLNIYAEKAKAQMKLIMLPARNFLSVIKTDIGNQKLSIAVFFVDDLKSRSKANDYHFVVQLNTSEKASFNYETNKCDVVNVRDYDDDYNDGHVIDMDLLKKFSTDGSYKCNLRIISDLHENNTKEELLQGLECPVCTNYMRAPIYQCLSGHSVCKDCKPKLEKCPTCSSGFGNTRNYSLEIFTNGIYFPCSHLDRGCEQNFLAKDIIKHEEDCRYKSFICPFRSYNCKWTGLLSELFAHLKNDHKNLTFTTHQEKSKVLFFKRQFRQTYCLVTHGEIFRVSYKQDKINQNAYWIVQLVGPKSEREAYSYEITLINEEYPYKKLTRLEMCQEYTNQDNIFSHSCKLPLSILSEFFYKGEFTYFVKVLKTGI